MSRYRQLPLERLASLLYPDYKGPKASFSKEHVLKAIVAIGEEGTVGRTRLASTLNLGQGEVRTLIKRLKDNQLILIRSNGCELTASGKKEYESISKAIPWRSPVDGKILGIGNICWAFIVRGRSKKVKMGIEQRDAAIRAGATGALTVLYSSDKFLVPVELIDCERGGPAEPWDLIRKAGPKESDVVIISGGQESLSAEYGGWSAVLTIL